MATLILEPFKLLFKVYRYEIADDGLKALKIVASNNDNSTLETKTAFRQQGKTGLIKLN